MRGQSAPSPSGSDVQAIRELANEAGNDAVRARKLARISLVVVSLVLILEVVRWLV